VIVDGLECLFWHRVDDAVDGEVDDVERVGQGGVFDSGRRPERPLPVSACGEKGPRTVARELLLEETVGQSRIRDSSGAPKHSRFRCPDQVKSPVHLRVDARNEEGRNRLDGGQVVPIQPGTLEAGEIRVDHGVVALEAENEGHVDADTRRDGLRDGGEALDGGRDLDHRVRAVDGRPEPFSLRDRASGVAGEIWCDLD